MPEINPTYSQFQKEVETLLQELITQLKNANLTKAQLARIASEIDFFEELRSHGFEKLVDKYFSNYNKEIFAVINEAKNQGVRDLTNVNLQALESIATFDKEYLLGRAKSWASEWQSELIKSVIRGDTIQQTINNLDGIPLTDSQVTTTLNTAYSDISRTATVEVYKDKPEQRFKYVAGMDINSPTKSDICKWLLTNQNPEGYTMAEIKAGIVTPFGLVNESGRVENWNCQDYWSPI